MQKEHVEASACQIAFKYRLGTHTTGPEEIQDFLFPPLRLSLFLALLPQITLAFSARL